MRADEQVGTLTGSLDQSGREVEGQMKERDAMTQNFGKLCKGLEWVEYERDGLRAKLHYSERERNKYVML